MLYQAQLSLIFAILVQATPNTILEPAVVFSPVPIPSSLLNSPLSLPTPLSGARLAGVQVEPACGFSNASMADAMNCKVYIANKGSAACTVPASGLAGMCRSANQKTFLFAKSLTGREETSSCSDVATGFQWIMDHCSRPDQTIAGKLGHVLVLIVLIPISYSSSC